MVESGQNPVPQQRRRKPAATSEPERSCNLEDTTAPAEQFPRPWGVVINDVFEFDVYAIFKHLSEELTLGDKATEWGSVLAAIDKSASNLYWAGKLTRKAKLADEAYSTKLGVRLEVLRTAAIQLLEADRADGKRSKAPTLQDIDDKMLASWPDEVSALRSDKAKMHGAYRAIEALEVAWRERCMNLRALSLQFRVSGT